MTIRILQIGYGGVGRRRCELLDADPRTTIIGVADNNAAARKAATERFPDARIDADHSLLLRELQPDAVVVSTPNTLHAPCALAALEAGSHVLVEKPFATTLADARALAQAATDRSRVLKLGANHMYFPAVTATLAHVATGALGDLQAISVRVGHGRYHELPAWFRDPALAGGGTLMDNGSHAVLLVAHLLDFDGDEVADMTCHLDYAEPQPSVEAAARCVGISRRGREIAIDSTWVDSDGYVFEVLVEGTLGSVRIENPGRAIAVNSKGESQTLEVDESAHSWLLDTVDFIDAIHHDRPAKYAGREGVSATYIHALSYSVCVT